MSDRLNRGVFAYIVLSICLAVGTFVVARIVPLERAPILTVWFIMILVSETVADLYPIVYFGFGNAQTEVTVSLGITFAVACIWPPEQAMLLVLIQTIVSDLVTHKSVDKIVFNGALYVTVIGGTSIIYHHFAVSQLRFLEGANLLAVGLAAAYYIVAECVMLSCLFSTLSRRPLLEVLVSFFRQSWLDFAALLPLGMVMTALFRESPLSILFLVPTFLLLYFSLKREQALRNQTEAILEKLVDVLESKSPETAQHSKRVRGWVEDMCEELGMESSEAAVVLQAAVLHDLGKVGLDEDLLRKPGLSAEEFHQIMGHSAVSASLLEGLTLFQGGRDIVLHHHERYDGNGYPDHLAGENIPFGARIIAVADSFDAMVSVRPYRAKSLTVMEALKILDQERGAQFDPNLVVTFSKIVHEHLEIGTMSNFPSAVQIDSVDGVGIAAGVQA
ncbi:MAG TPA: HD domain-containing phosphohydrolase [Candidatus Deferrimicrobium sp.]|nr:HD domain-containing phosphohydrolase [Candidatus Deferrimicrobium sp.]